jgi:anti-sigma factor RsiW
VECKVVRQYLNGYLDQALTPELHEAVEAHLFQCDECWQELTELRNLQTALADPLLQGMVLHAPSPLPADFTNQVMARVLDERPAGVNLIWPWLRQRWSTRQYASVAYAMSATMVIVSAGNMLYLWNQTTDRLGVWGAQTQAYWDALQAQVGGTGAHVFNWLTVLFQMH